MRQPEVLEDLDADAVVAAVGLVAQGQVGLDRVQALVLEAVGLDLLDQSDAAAFLGQVDQHAGPFVGRSSPGPCGAGRRSRSGARPAGRR